MAEEYTADVNTVSYAVKTVPRILMPIMYIRTINTFSTEPSTGLTGESPSDPFQGD